MLRATAALLLLTISAPGLRAAEEAKVELKETYWQPLTGATAVALDSNRDPVFFLKGGYYFLKTGKFVAYREGGPWGPAHFDRSGRVWVMDRHQVKVHFWNGTRWETLDRRPVKVFDDTAGRVFLFDGKSVRVLGTDGKWTEQAICEKPHLEDVGFVEHGKRVWLWGSREKPGGANGITGVWSFADGKWTHHDLKGPKFGFESVKLMHPLEDGRLLLISDLIPKGRPLAGYGLLMDWDPDKDILSRTSLTRGDPVIGIDGTVYLLNQRRSDGEMIAVNAKGKSRDLTKKEAEQFQVAPKAIINGQHILFAKLGEPLPLLPHADGAFVGVDRDGRYYYQSANRKAPPEHAVFVVWPRHEKPGDILRLQKESKLVARVTQDEVGKIWAEVEANKSLLQWHGGKWLDTPVQPLYHPTWMARPAPPWQPWQVGAQHTFRLHGKNGGILFVRVRDSYHIDDLPAPGVQQPLIPRKLPDGKTPYWPEAWLFRDGKWTGPLDLATLLSAHAAALLADFPTTEGTISAFAFANDGARLWAAFDGKVFTADKTGKVIEADWPREKPKTPPLVMLSKLPDGKVLLTGTFGDGHTLSVSAEGKIESKGFAMPAGSPAANPNERLAHWKLAKDGTLWYWTADRYQYGGQVWHFRDGKWAEKKGVGAPMHEDADGNLWCRPLPLSAGKVQLLVVSGTQTKELTFSPEDMPLGFQEVPKGAFVWAMGDWLYRLDPNGDGGKPVLRRRLLSERVYGLLPAVIDGKGNVLLGSYRGELK